MQPIHLYSGIFIHIRRKVRVMVQIMTNVWRIMDISFRYLLSVCSSFHADSTELYT